MSAETATLVRHAIEIRVGCVPRANHCFPCTLEATQSFVGGMIECVFLPADMIVTLERIFGVTLGDRACLVVNDDGLGLGLPVNSWATLISMKSGAGPIVGDAFICDVP